MTVAKQLELPVLISSIYDAVLQSDAWPQVLTEIGALMGGAWVLLGLIRLNGKAEFNLQDRAGDPDHLALFHARFTTPDINPSVRRLLCAPVGASILREQEMDDDAWKRHPLYREIYRPRGLYHGLGSLVLRTDTHIAMLGLNRTRKTGPFTRRDLSILAQLRPHLERALHVASKIAAFDAMQSSYEALWDRLAQGVILLDRSSMVLWANGTGRSILDAADGLDLRHGQLHAANPADNAALARSIAAAVEAPSACSGDCLLSVARPSCKRPYNILVSPVSVRPPAIGRVPVAVAIVSDPERQVEAAPARLARLFGLTPREAALAALLVAGNNLDDIAGQLSMGRNTVRQHLRAIFEKTGTHRQSELMRLLLRSPAGLFSESAPPPNGGSGLAS